jgi:putative spermidine/putrescine transport system permease protein
VSTDTSSAVNLARRRRRPRLALVALLGAPMTWMGVAYLASLAALLLTALYRIDPFTFSVVEEIGTANLRRVATKAVYRAITLRTVGIAISVTVLCALAAIPLAFFIAKVAPRRWRSWLVISVTLPLWASYLVKVYAMRSILSEGGVLDQSIGSTPGVGIAATVLTLAYLWFPYMVLPVYAGLERLPDSLLEASGDLGARSYATLRHVVLPVIVPSVIAGSVFTFSLSLGDYIAADQVGGKAQMLGRAVYREFGANNIPLAAAMAVIPVVVIVCYLLAIRRTGAFESL